MGRYGIVIHVAAVAEEVYSPRDLLPGLEVRLLNHQVIGVAW